MRAQCSLVLTTLMFVMAIVTLVSSPTLTPLNFGDAIAYRGSGRVEIAYRGSGRLADDYRGSGRVEADYRGSGRFELAYRGSGRISIG